MRKLGMILGLVVASAAAPALAVTDGELDGHDHPQVGTTVAQDRKGDPLWRCNGTMIAPKVFLTAGHCTEARSKGGDLLRLVPAGRNRHRPQQIPRRRPLQRHDVHPLGLRPRCVQRARQHRHAIAAAVEQRQHRRDLLR